MSRFADPTATEVVDLGPCGCTGSPHDRDEATIRTSVTFADVRTWARMENAQNDRLVTDGLASFIVSWNLLDDAGDVVPPDPDSVALLGLDTVTPLITACSKVVSASLPNASGAPSRASSRGSASRAPTKTQKPGT